MKKAILAAAAAALLTSPIRAYSQTDTSLGLEYIGLGALITFETPVAIPAFIDTLYIAGGEADIGLGMSKALYYKDGSFEAKPYCELAVWPARNDRTIVPGTQLSIAAIQPFTKDNDDWTLLVLSRNPDYKLPQIPFEDYRMLLNKRLHPVNENVDALLMCTSWDHHVSINDFLTLSSGVFKVYFPARPIDWKR